MSKRRTWQEVSHRWDRLRCEALENPLEAASIYATIREELLAWVAVEVTVRRAGAPRGMRLPKGCKWEDVLPHLVQAQHAHEQKGQFAHWCKTHQWPPNFGQPGESAVRYWLKQYAEVIKRAAEYPEALFFAGRDG